MSHCDYDTIFYRVFCATVLGIAFTFTVILTNVFIDIDGLLSKKDVETNPVPDFSNYKIEDIKNEVQYDDLDDEANLYRGKRSLEPENFLFEVKNPNIKKVLTNKLATLLEELDEEESTKKSVVEGRRQINTDNNNDIKKEKYIETENDNMLHLAMHNILLQGIIGHMNLNNVYKKVHMLIKNFYEHNKSEKSQKTRATSKEMTKEYPRNNEEQKFLEELLKCKTLKDQINEVKNNTQYNKRKEPKVIIKTIIEINEKGKLQKENNSSTNDIIGLIKLIYNGKSIKFEKLEDTDNKQPEGQNIYPAVTTRKSNKDAINLNQIQFAQEKQNSNSNWNKVIENYLKQYPVVNNENYLEDKISKINRQKRQIKIHYLDSKHATAKPKRASKIKKDDEELYIEIETHFDGKGIKGEKKKKLVQNLIDKIQRAIRDDSEAETHKKSMYNNIKVKKRNQDPIKQKNDFFLNKIVPVIRSIEHRQLNPIGKLPFENMLSNYGETIWNEKLDSQPFISGKSLNSAEMGSFINYDNMNNEIPKREQKPINIEINGLRTRDDDLNNASFYLKDVDGSGFSIGFNQYVDEPPDINSLKLFNGVENLIQEYHKTYDDVNKNANIDNEQEKYSKENQESIKNSHDISRRSVNDDNSDSYRILLKNIIKPLNFYKPWQSDSKIINRHKKSNNYRSSPGTLNIISKPIKINNLSIAFVNNYYKEKTGRDNRHSLDNLLKRRKRSLKVKKISSLNSKIKLNRFINTNTKINTKLFKTKKRNKRQVNKIRIIARERPQKKSNEDNVILVSPNNLYSNKAAKEIRTDADVSVMQNTDTIPFSEFLNLNYANQPMMDEYRNDAQTLSFPKYPHIFFEEQRSREYSREDISVKPYRIQAIPSVEQQTDITERPTPGFSNIKLPSVDEIINAILPPKSNYKVTVKISPKNTSDIHSGFKEVHTSVNKSFDRNGIRYFSLLNVSQLSKVENVNESKNVPQKRRHLPSPPIIKELKEKEKQIETLFQFHKKRIDSQLDNLKKERLFLENVLDKKANENTKFEDHKNLKDVDHVINLVREIEYPLSKTIPMIINNVTERLKTTEKIQNDKIKKTQEKKDTRQENDESKMNIFSDLIKNNEQSTKDILKKIDMNTDLLRQFFHKLSELYTKTPTTEHIARKANDDSYHQHSNLRNNSQNTQSNPFTYRIPHGNPNGDLSKIISTLKPPNFPIRKNQSRFFIDDLEDYNSVSATIRINTTHL